MTTEDRTKNLKHRVAEFNRVREHVLSGDFLIGLLEAHLPTPPSPEVAFQLKVAIQEQLQSLQHEEDLISAEVEEIKAEIGKEIEAAARACTTYPIYPGWKTSVRRSYKYNEEAIKDAASAAGIPEDRLYKVTTKFDPSALMKSDISTDLREAVNSNKIVSKHTAVVKWINES